MIALPSNEILGLLLLNTYNIVVVPATKIRHKAYKLAKAYLQGDVMNAVPKIGISGLGVLHTDQEVPDTDSKFRMVKEADVFDYYDRTPPRSQLAEHQKASKKYGLPIKSSGFFYMLGRDEALLEDNIRLAEECGADTHNVQIFATHNDGHLVSDEEIVDAYLWLLQIGQKYNVTPCLENHINMWSEHCGRVAQVSEMIKARGADFNMTMDHSHVIFKIDNEKEQTVQNMKDDVDSGALVLDPRLPGNVAKKWIESNDIVLAHARPAVPNNPVNIWGKHPDGRPGRGVQYPWVEPKPGEWHSSWDSSALEPWKITLRDLLQHHVRNPESRLRYISLEMIPPPDYGAGAKYSIFDNNVECARWIRETWDEIVKIENSSQKA